MSEARLIFVYNSESGMLNELVDRIHKLAAPYTHECHLWRLTHSHFGIRREWTKFFDRYDLDVAFLHRDELEKEFPGEEGRYPAIFLASAKTLSPFISEVEINACSSTQKLMDLLKQRLRDAALIEE
ncbi:MAG: hypothetical protein RQ758_05085 [Methanomicrobiaceae archaeon]|nr:hypothetical protein [Methanomicrobiaceae archaeon]